MHRCRARRAAQGLGRAKTPRCPTDTIDRIPPRHADTPRPFASLFGIARIIHEFHESRPRIVLRNCVVTSPRETVLGRLIVVPSSSRHTVGHLMDFMNIGHLRTIAFFRIRQRTDQSNMIKITRRVEFSAAPPHNPQLSGLGEWASTAYAIIRRATDN